MGSARGLGSYSPQSLGGKITGPSADEGAMEGDQDYAALNLGVVSNACQG